MNSAYNAPPPPPLSTEGVNMTSVTDRLQSFSGDRGLKNTLERGNYPAREPDKQRMLAELSLRIFYPGLGDKVATISVVLCASVCDTA